MPEIKRYRHGVPNWIDVSTRDVAATWMVARCAQVFCGQVGEGGFESRDHLEASGEEQAEPDTDTDGKLDREEESRFS